MPPRPMPRLDKALRAHADLAIGLAHAGEIAREDGSAVVRREWTTARLETLYEASFLQVFNHWEMSLAAVLYRSMCGYESSKGRETIIPQPKFPLSGRYYPTLEEAEKAVHDGQHYLLWHDVMKVIGRCNRHILPFDAVSHPDCIGLQATILNSHIDKLTQYGAIRHRIAHEQGDAKAKFNDACKAIAKKPYFGSSAGKFLRDKDETAAPPESYLEVILKELVGLLQQMI